MAIAPYRRNAAGIFFKQSGEILVAERIDAPGAWQFPQGGVDDGETVEAAFAREMWEELGLGPETYEVIEQRGGYRYRFPPEHRKRDRWIGQEQTYFKALFLATDNAVRLDGHSREFSDWKWINPADFRIDWVIDFKRDTYRSVFFDFFAVELE